MPLAPATRNALRAFNTSLADRVLQPDDSVYVGEVNISASGADPIAEMTTEIDWQEGGGVCLFTGQRGTGKSTELQRLKKKLEEEVGATVFYVDISEFVLLTKEIEISDFLVSVAGALSEQIEQKYGASPGQRSYWERFSKFLQNKVEFKEIGASLAGVSLKASLKTDPDFKSRLQSAARGHVTQIVAEAREFFQDAVQFVRTREDDVERKVVLLIDSIERIRGVGKEAMNVYESVRNLFFGHADSLRIPMLHVVYTIPPYLSVLAPGAVHLLSVAKTQRLVSTHIFKDRSREPDPAGLTLLRRVITVRYPAWEQVFSIDALDRLALDSGGDLREFFRLIRMCLLAVRSDAQLPLSAEMVAPVENAARNEMLPIPTDQLGWLKRIGATHGTCLQHDGDLPLLAHFLDNRLVLNYRNGSDWYDVHPLLRPLVDSHESTTEA